MTGTDWVDGYLDASIGLLGPDGRITTNRDDWNLAAYLVEVGLLAPPAA